MTRRRRTLAIDFDGVLHQYDGYRPDAPLNPPIAGARAAVEALLARGHEVVVFTTAPAERVRPWLAEHGFPPLEVTATKRPFWAILDDRAICFSGTWNDVVARIERFEPHWIAARRRLQAVSPEVVTDRTAAIREVTARITAHRAEHGYRWNYAEHCVEQALSDAEGRLDEALVTGAQRRAAHGALAQLRAVLAEAQAAKDASFGPIPPP